MRVVAEAAPVLGLKLVSGTPKPSDMSTINSREMLRSPERRMSVVAQDVENQFTLSDRFPCLRNQASTVTTHNLRIPEP